MFSCLSICIALPLILEGLIPRELGLLDGITDLDLHGNDLQGVLPHRILVGMNKIQYLRLQMNGLFGSIHKEMTRMKHLKELYLFGNFFAGSIPKQLSKLKQVEVIDLYANQLTGTVRISKTTKVAKMFQRIEYQKINFLKRTLRCKNLTVILSQLHSFQIPKELAQLPKLSK